MRIAPVCLLLIAVCASSSVTAQSCPATSAATSRNCVQVHTFDADQFAAMRTAQPGAPTADLNDGVPWIGQAGIAPPLDAKPAGTGATLRTSLGQWRDFENQLLSRRIDEAKAMNRALPQPKSPAVLPSPFELWTSVGVAGLAQDTDNAVKTGVGAGYKMSKSATLGVEATRADSRPAASALGTQDDTLAAFATYQPTSMVSIDARTHWEAATTGSARTDSTAVSIAPKLKVPMKLSGGQMLEPFVTIKDELSRAASAELPGQTKNTLSAGTGVTFAKPGQYTMSLTADAENLGTPDPTTYKSRFQLSVPLR